MKNKYSNYIIVGFIIVFVVLLGIFNTSNAAATYYQYIKTGINEFPTSYQERLRQLANKYPNWKFQAYYTGISWDEFIKEERGEDIHRSRISANSPSSWKHNCGFVDNGWACASDASIKYYADPRNFLNETQIFQFVESSYNEKVQTVETIKNSVKGTFLDNTITCKDLNNNIVTMSYAEMIVKAAKESNISAFYIKSKIIQEVGNQGSGSVSGKYPGYEGYYNFYNFGAYDEGDPIANGLQYAKNKGWDSPYKAIVDGAKLIGKNYIEAGQNTAYFNKWDVVGTKILKEGESQTVKKSDLFWHQYMTNIQDPTSQSYSNYKLYANSLQSNITFIIPIYNDMPASNPMPQDVPVQGISLNKDKVVISIDEKIELEAKLNPSNASNQNVIWEVSDSEIARVWNGGIRGLKEGKTVVTAKSEDGGKIATCEILVRDPNKKYVTELAIEKDTYIVSIDDAVDINFTYSPSNASNTDFSWTSSNPEILRVWGNRFRALKEGTAEISVTNDTGWVVAKAKVIIRDPNKKYVTGLSIEKEVYVAKIGEAVDINFAYTPNDAANTEFNWTTPNPEIIRVWGNRFRALEEGITEISVTNDTGWSEAKAKVIVRDPNKKYVENITFDKTQYTADLDEAVDIPFNYSPNDAINAEFEWLASDPDVIRVWGNRFRALKEGTSDIIVRTVDGSIEKRLKVTVKDYSKIKVEDIDVGKTEYNLGLDVAVDIPFSYSPIESSNAEFEWTSSNDEILRVWGNRFRTLKEGTAYVIVRTIDGTVEKKIKVNVKDNRHIKVDNIKFDSTKYVVNIDEAIDIPFSYSPINASNAEFEWTASNEEILRVWGNRFRALKEGIADVIVRTVDGTVERRIQVVVRDPSKNYVKDIQLTKTEYTVSVDEAVDLPFTYTPSNAVNAEFEWTSSNDEILRVWGNRFRALKKGTANVIVRTLDGTVEKTIKVTVK